MDLRVSHFANPYNIDQSDAYLGIMVFILYFNIKNKKKGILIPSAFEQAYG